MTEHPVKELCCVSCLHCLCVWECVRERCCVSCLNVCVCVSVWERDVVCHVSMFVCVWVWERDVLCVMSPCLCVWECERERCCVSCLHVCVCESVWERDVGIRRTLSESSPEKSNSFMSTLCSLFFSDPILGNWFVNHYNNEMASCPFHVIHFNILHFPTQTDQFIRRHLSSLMK